MTKNADGSRFELPTTSRFASERAAVSLLLKAGIPKSRIFLAHRELSAALDLFRSRSVTVLTPREQEIAFAAVAECAKELIAKWQRIPPDLRSLPGVPASDCIYEFADGITGYADSLKYEQPEDLAELCTDVDPALDVKATAAEYRAIEARLAERRRSKQRGVQPAVQRRQELLLNLAVTWFRHHPAAKKGACAPVSWRGEQGKHGGPLLEYVQELLRFEGAQYKGRCIRWANVIGADLFALHRDALRECRAGHRARMGKSTKGV